MGQPGNRAGNRRRRSWRKRPGAVFHSAALTHVTRGTPGGRRSTAHRVAGRGSRRRSEQVVSQPDGKTFAVQRGAAARPGRRCDRNAVAAAIRWRLSNSRSRPGAVLASIDLNGSSGLKQSAVARRCVPSAGHERRFGRLGCQVAVAAPQAASGMGAISASMLRARCFSISRSISPLRSAVAGAPVVLAARKQVARSRRRRNWS